MSNRILRYPTHEKALKSMKRLLRLYPPHPDSRVDIVSSPSWLYPFEYLIRVTGRDGRVSYWGKAK